MTTRFLVRWHGHGQSAAVVSRFRWAEDRVFGGRDVRLSPPADLDAQLLTFTAAKTRKEVRIPLHSALEGHLLKSPGIGKAFLFPSLAGKRTGGKNGLSGQFAGIMAKAGIESKITRHTAHGRANSSLSFHSLRHSFNSAMANAGVSQEIRQKLTGHASAAMNAHYTHHELEPLRAAICKMSSLNLRK